MELKKLQKRVLEISYKHNLSHIGSCLTALPIINEIYSIKKPDEPFILSSGHAGLALYVVIEAYGGRNAEEIFEHHGVHPDRCKNCVLDCSTGSLGQGLPIAVGMAISNRSKNVYCLISDGECSEGSIWESCGVIDRYEVTNLKIYVNINGYSAYASDLTVSERPRLIFTEKSLVFTNVEQFPFLKGQDAHYHVMTKEEYDNAQDILSGTI